MKKLLLSCLLFIVTCMNAQIDLGVGSTTKGVAPVSTYYGYSYVQQIFPKSEINADAAGNITGLKFYLASSATLTNSADWIVYLGHTAKSSFTSNTDWVALTDLTQVYAGTVTNNSGVVEVTFTTPFPYNNVDNLVIAAEENASGYDSNGYAEAFYVYNTSSNRTLYYRNDSTNPDPANPPTTGSSTYLSRAGYNSAVTILGLTPSALPTCPNVSAPAVDATGVAISPSITWTAVAGATGYRLSVGTTSGGTDVMNNVDLGDVTTYQITPNLQYSTQYYYTLTAYNTAGSSSGCSERSFTTLNIPCPTVTAPTASATGVPVTPTITWDAVTDATGYKLSVGTTAGGTDVLNNIDLGNITSYTFTTPLLNSTKYFYTVNSYNAVAVSASCNERNFTTVCGAVAAPFAESFSSGSLPSCWTNQNPTSSSSDSNVKWKFSGSADYGANLANNGRPAGSYAWVDASSPYAGVHTVELLTPFVDLTGINTPYVSFDWFKNHSTSTSTTVSPSTYDNNKLSVDINDGNGWVNIFTGTSNAQVWRTAGIALASSYVGATVQLRFTVDKDVDGNGYFYDDVLLDNVEIKQAPSCLVPNTLAYTNLTSTGADVTWVAPATPPADGYDVYYSNTSTAPTAGTNPQYTSVSGTTQNIPGTPGDVFYVWVRSHCSASSQSTWVGPVSFTIPFPAPANDNCSDAAALTVGATFDSNAVTATSVGATSDGTALSCQTNTNNNVWYSVVVPNSGNLTIETKSVTGSPYTDSILNVFSGSCGSLASVACDDDNGDGNFSKVTLTGQTPGTTLLVSVWKYGAGAGADGPFQISAYDTSVLATTEVAAAKNEIKAYPNPFTDDLNISDIAKVKSVSVNDTAGRLVKTIINPESSLHLGELKSGMYILTLEMKDGSKQAVKVLKK